MMVKIWKRLSQTLKIPSGVSLSTEKISSHVIIYTMNIPSVGGEAGHDLRTDEARGTCYKNFWVHFYSDINIL